MAKEILVMKNPLLLIISFAENSPFFCGLIFPCVVDPENKKPTEKGSCG